MEPRRTVVTATGAARLTDEETSAARSNLSPAGLVSILAISAATMLVGLGSTPLWEPDEPRFAEATRQMIARGDYLTPWFNGQPRFEKPPLMYWLQAAASAIAGPGETAARLPAALAGLACVLMLALHTSRLLGARAGLLAALALATTFRFVLYARQGLTDVPVLAFMMLALYGFQRSIDADRRARTFALVAWAAVGLAALTKGPVAVLPVAIWVGFLIVTRQWSGLGRMRPLPGLALAAVIALPWYVFMAVVHGRAYLDFALGYEVVARYASAEFPGPSRGFFFYMGVWPGDGAPWSLVFIAALVAAARSWRRLPSADRHAIALGLVWFGVVLVLFSSARYKLPHYIIPLYPAMALLVGWIGDRVARAIVSTAPWTVAAAATGIVVLALAGVTFVFLSRVWSIGAVDPGMLLPFALLCSGAAVLWLVWRGRPIAAHVALAAGVGAAFVPLALIIAPHYLARFQPIPPLGGTIARLAGPHDRVALYGSYGAPGLVYYSRHTVEWIRSPEAAVEFLSGDGRRFCVVPASELDALRARARRPLHVIEERPQFAVRLRSLLAPNPSVQGQMLALVATVPAEKATD